MRLLLQLYTVRREAQKNLTDTLNKIALAGFEGIEAARIPLNAKTLTALQIARTDFNLITHSFQLKYPQLCDVSGTLPFLHSAKCGTAVLSVLPPSLFGASYNKLARFYSRLNSLAAQYSREGVALAYHHHDFEAMRFGTMRGFDIMDKELDYTAVKLVCDTYWLQKSGYCPQKYIKAHKGFVAGVHLRDYTVNRSAVIPLPRGGDCALGDGTLNFTDIIAASLLSGCEYCAVEQNSLRPFEDMKKSINYIMPIIKQNKKTTKTEE